MVLNITLNRVFVNYNLGMQCKNISTPSMVVFAVFGGVFVGCPSTQAQGTPPAIPDCCAAPAGRAAALIASVQAEAETQGVDTSAGPSDAPPGMVWIPPGEFTMGSDAPDVWPQERPAHRVRVGGFWMDQTEVTNAQFAAFVEATGYVTVAERPVDWDEFKKQLPPGTPKPPDEALQPGSLVFSPPAGPVPLNDYSAWWAWTVGADWRHPHGPASSIEGRENHPVVHIAWEDAKAYADWAGKQLPNEAQWEYAAKGGSDDTRFAWGQTLRPDDRPMANIWDGAFPHRNTKDDGYLLTAPVKTYPPNGYGLYDTAGNVWEWTADWYRDDRNAVLAKRGGVAVDPAGPDTPSDVQNPRTPVRVVKGGSYLCHADYCESYRPAARRGGAVDTGLQHTGFRCVIVPASAPE